MVWPYKTSKKKWNSAMSTKFDVTFLLVHCPKTKFDVTFFIAHYRKDERI